MQTFFMFGKYSSDALEGITPQRTQQATQAIERTGGKVKAIYALLGEHDLVVIAELPNTRDAMKTSIALTVLTGISFARARSPRLEWTRPREGRG